MPLYRSPDNSIRKPLGSRILILMLISLSLSSVVMTSESCDPSYYTFNHDYVCTQSMIDNYELCDIELHPDDGRPMLLNGPCYAGDAVDYGASSNSCIFQPRIHIKDNWGYCTGYCEGDPAGELCYDGSDVGEENECALDCPAEEGDCDAIDAEVEYPHYANPWIYYNGLVEVTPE